ncbi:MAG TPA: FCD domain-containing protein, partial [Ideonella sp.]|nr:FCD domain-containing protein [Ideonella sp.]
SGNPLIVESMATHWQHLRRSMGEVLRRPSFARGVWKEHAAILDAIAAGDGAAAAQAIAEHVRVAHERVGAELATAERAAA